MHDIIQQLEKKRAQARQGGGEKRIAAQHANLGTRSSRSMPLGPAAMILHIQPAGNLPGRTQTLPLAVYLGAQTEPGTALVLSAVLVVVSLAVLVVLRGRWLPGLLRR